MDLRSKDPRRYNYLFMNDRNSYVIIPAVEFIRIGDVYVTKDYFHISYTLLVKLGLIREVELNDSIFEAIMGSF